MNIEKDIKEAVIQWVEGCSEVTRQILSAHEIAALGRMVEQQVESAMDALEAEVE